MKQQKNLKGSNRSRLFRQRSASHLRSLRTYGILFGVALVLIGATSHLPKAGAQNKRERFQQDLGQVFTVHEDLSIDPHAAAEQVRANGRVSLITSSQDFELRLQPTDLRAPNYRAAQTDADGVTRPTAMPEASTYKGNIDGVWASDARFTVQDNKIEGMIITPAQTYFVEPAQKYSSSAAPTDYLLYRAQDVRPDINRT